MSTIGYPQDWQLPKNLPQTPDSAEHLDALKRVEPDVYARVLRYLEERYSLTEDDLAGYDELLLALTRSIQDTDRLILANTELFRVGVRNALARIGIDSVSQKDLTEMTEIVRINIGASFEGVETFLESFHPMEAVDEFFEDLTPSLRSGAIEEMNDRFGHVFDGWNESKNALSDEEMERRFAAIVDADPKFLSTYFGSASAGLVDRRLQSEVDLRSSKDIARLEWPKFLFAMKRRITRSLEVTQPGDERRFLPENCFLTANGTAAFQLLRRAYMPRGTRVLATMEEYSEIIQDMSRAGSEVQLFSSLDELVLLLDEHPFDYMLVSEVGRLGGVYPLGVYNEARKLLSPNTKLIVDACQSAGRWQHDLRSCEADAVFLSTQKGSDFGWGVGALALTKDFEHRGMTDMRGSISHQAVARTAYAMNPLGLPTLKAHERAHENSQRTRKFLALIEAINQEVGNAIQIHHPTQLSESVSGHAIELSVDGVSRKALCRVGRSYGIHIPDTYVSAASDESVRIAFHPYMNDDALKILGYLLRECYLDTIDSNDY